MVEICAKHHEFPSQIIYTGIPIVDEDQLEAAAKRKISKDTRLRKNVTENKSYTSQIYAEEWLRKNVEITTESKLKLSGKDSRVSCQGIEDSPLTARQIRDIVGS